jgi:Na+-translocating ferredoxin:NAD+ oxidoreductase RnfE subunit
MTTVLIVPGVAPPAADLTLACMGKVAVLSAAIFWVMRDPVPMSTSLPISVIAIATFSAVPLFL